MRLLTRLALGAGLTTASAGAPLRASPDWDRPPGELKIADDERAALESGAPVYRTALERGASQGSAMILVRASPTEIWSTGSRYRRAWTRELCRLPRTGRSSVNHPSR